MFVCRRVPAFVGERGPRAARQAVVILGCRRDRLRTGRRDSHLQGRSTRALAGEARVGSKRTGLLTFLAFQISSMVDLQKVFRRNLLGRRAQEGERQRSPNCRKKIVVARQRPISFVDIYWASNVD